MLSWVAMSLVAAGVLCGGAGAAQYVPGAPGGPWSREEMLVVKAKLSRLFDVEQAGHISWEWKGLHPGEEVSVPNRPVPLVLRLGFHDCLRYTDGTGGCDGCLNLHDGFIGALDGPWYQLQLDMEAISMNNGLQHIVKLLEEIYVNKDFPSKTPPLPESLRDSGKSRADFWAFAAIVAVEYGIETNNGICASQDFEKPAGYEPPQRQNNQGVMKDKWDWARFDPTNGGAHCNDQQGEPECAVELERPIAFKTGRADCVTLDGGYNTEKPERHADPHTNGAGTAAFFQRDFAFNGREMVAILGAHTMGRLHQDTTMLPYVWIKSGGQQFNNQYYRNLVGRPAWYFRHNAGTKDGCTKGGDAFGERAPARWLANARLHLKTGGPAFWIQEKLACVDVCDRDDGKDNAEACCTERPAGAMCKPDGGRTAGSGPEADPSPDGGCEKFQFHVGLDECMLNVDMGMYKEFGVRNGIPYGCVGLEDFTLTEWEKTWTAGTQFQSHWSKINGRRAEPQCPFQTMQIPSGSTPLHEMVEEFADHQDRWVAAFVPAFEKMLANGYGPNDLQAGPDQWTAVTCPRVMPEAATQFWECTAPPPTPIPPTPAPPTPSPPTLAPPTPAPPTLAPPTPAPPTLAPPTQIPLTPAPPTAAPVTPSPVTPAPIMEEPTTPAPASSFWSTSPAPEGGAPSPSPSPDAAGDTPAPFEGNGTTVPGGQGAAGPGADEDGGRLWWWLVPVVLAAVAVAVAAGVWWVYGRKERASFDNVKEYVPMEGMVEDKRSDPPSHSGSPAAPASLLASPCEPSMASGPPTRGAGSGLQLLSTSGISSPQPLAREPASGILLHASTSHGSAGGSATARSTYVL
eukprot:TRINITY_DN1963_c0_g1_i1.p1 TRINITY_DN1963_c0_g1~~TRINITY_DN1963_c0_g1_i1.p1  ORF type:complete len:854 (+),score=199.95 TRINITY_DN1963_c0_g1_i1:51-2612(+)